jgi:hypothetical protein
MKIQNGRESVQFQQRLAGQPHTTNETKGTVREAFSILFGQLAVPNFSGKLDSSFTLCRIGEDFRMKAARETFPRGGKAPKGQGPLEKKAETLRRKDCGRTVL